MRAFAALGKEGRVEDFDESCRACRMAVGTGFREAGGRLITRPDRIPAQTASFELMGAGGRGMVAPARRRRRAAGFGDGTGNGSGRRQSVEGRENAQQRHRHGCQKARAREWPFGPHQLWVTTPG